MGVSKEQAAANRRAIVTAAAELFRERGVDGVGVSELMKQAGFTQGGFYNHFKSKDALVAEVVAQALAEGRARMIESSKLPAVAGRSSLERFIDYYLSPTHRDNIENGCPLAGFAAEVTRIGGETQVHFVGGVDNGITLLAGMIANHTPPSADTSRTLREQATSLYSALVGAIVLSRSVHASDPVLADDILSSNREALLAAYC